MSKYSEYPEMKDYPYNLPNECGKPCPGEAKMIKDNQEALNIIQTIAFENDQIIKETSNQILDYLCSKNPKLKKNLDQQGVLENEMGKNEINLNLNAIIQHSQEHLERCLSCAIIRSAFKNIYSFDE